MNNNARKIWIALIASVLGLAVLSTLFLTEQRPPDIVVIVMDTTRRDHLSCYGYESNTTPTLDELADESTVFARAYSTSGWTNSAHASLFTGLFPSAHQTTQRRWSMTEEHTTLAEVLSDHGYTTFAAVENPMLARRHRFDQGFDTYIETWKGPTNTAQSHSVLTQWRQFLNARDSKKPFFAFFNLITPHSPYDSLPVRDNPFITDPSIRCDDNRWRDFYLGRASFSPAEYQHLRERYDGELLVTDLVIGRIIAELKSRNAWDNTLLVVTADHGENIGDHDMVDHVFSLHETLTQIPLIIRYPLRFGANTVDERRVQLTDLFPTILDCAGIDPGKYASQGRNLLDETLSSEDGVVICEYDYPLQAINAFAPQDRDNPALEPYRRDLKSVTMNGCKLIWASDGKHELYDLERDPNETKNLIDSEAFHEIRLSLARRLERAVAQSIQMRAAGSATPTETLDEDTREALKALGYLD